MPRNEARNGQLAATTKLCTGRYTARLYGKVMNNTLSPPKVKRKGSSRRPRAGSFLPPFTQEPHDSALYAIRTYLKGRTSYDSFPVSFRIIVLDSKLEVRKALTCLLSNGMYCMLLRASVC